MKATDLVRLNPRFKIPPDTDFLYKTSCERAVVGHFHKFYEPGNMFKLGTKIAVVAYTPCNPLRIASVVVLPTDRPTGLIVPVAVLALNGSALVVRHNQNSYATRFLRDNGSIYL